MSLHLKYSYRCLYLNIKYFLFSSEIIEVNKFQQSRREHGVCGLYETKTGALQVMSVLVLLHMRPEMSRADSSSSHLCPRTTWDLNLPLYIHKNTDISVCKDQMSFIKQWTKPCPLDRQFIKTKKDRN